MGNCLRPIKKRTAEAARRGTCFEWARLFRRRVALAMLILAAGSAPLWAKERVIILGFDGLTAKGIAETNTLNIHALMKSGAWTMHARAAMPDNSSNAPAMIMSAPPAPGCRDDPGSFPTVYSLEHAQSPEAKIGVFTDFPSDARLFEPGAVTKVYTSRATDAGAFDDNSEIDVFNHAMETDTFDHALAYFRSDKPDLLFIHIDLVDHMGRTWGFGSTQYLAAVERADVMLGRLMRTLDELHLRESTTIMLVSGDEGLSRVHRVKPSMRDVNLPWIISGPGIRADHELKTQVAQYDTAATLARALRVKPSPCWQSSVIAEAFTK